MPVVPIHTDTPATANAPTPPPPSVFTLMAAAQMAKEGKLVAQDSKAKPVA